MKQLSVSTFSSSRMAAVAAKPFISGLRSFIGTVSSFHPKGLSSEKEVARSGTRHKHLAADSRLLSLRQHPLTLAPFFRPRAKQMFLEQVWG